MRWLAVVAVVLVAGTASAQVPIKSIPAGPDHIVPLRKGYRAPYTGQLFGPATALRWANWLQQYRLRLKSDTAYQQATCKVERVYDAKLLRVEQQRSSVLTTDLRARLARSEQARLHAEQVARNPPWYRASWFGVALGVAGSLAIGGVTAWAVSLHR